MANAQSFVDETEHCSKCLHWPTFILLPMKQVFNCHFLPQALGMGATLKMVETDKDRIEAEVEEEEKRRKKAEKSVKTDSWEAEENRQNRRQQSRSRSRRADPNNPTKEEVDAQQEMENMTWADRWMKNKKVKHVVQSSKMMSKVKIKMKEKIKSTNPALQSEPEPSKDDATSSGQVASPAASHSEDSNDAKTAGKQQARPRPTNNELPGMIGSLEEYANIVGKTVSQLADAKYEPPEVSESESEDEQPAEDEGDLWGAIMGN